MRFDRDGWGLTERGEIWCQIVLSLSHTSTHYLTEKVPFEVSKTGSDHLIPQGLYLTGNTLLQK